MMPSIMREVQQPARRFVRPLFSRKPACAGPRDYGGLNLDQAVDRFLALAEGPAELVNERLDQIRHCRSIPRLDVHLCRHTGQQR